MTNFNERTNTLLYKNISLTLYSRKGDVSCVREMSWKRRQTAILTPSSSDHSSTFSSSWLGLLNRGSLRAQSPLSAAGSQFGILSPTDSNRLCPGYIIVLRTPASAVLPLIYTGASLDSSVEGQYITSRTIGEHSTHYSGVDLNVLSYP